MILKKRLDKISNALQPRPEMGGVFIINKYQDWSQEEAIAVYKSKNNIQISDSHLVVLLQSWEEPSEEEKVQLKIFRRSLKNIH